MTGKTEGEWRLLQAICLFKSHHDVYTEKLTKNNNKNSAKRAI